MADYLKQDMIAALKTAGTASAIDDATGAALACIAYKPLWDEALPGWTELARENLAASGYDGIAYYHPASRSLVVASRGVEGLSGITDWRSSAKMALLKNRGQVVHAVDLLRRAWAAAPQGQVDQLYLAGHSLGGGMTDALAVLGRSALAGFGTRPIKGLGIASAGFADAVRAFAAGSGLTIDMDDAKSVRHFVRGHDPVPKHPEREVFGQDQKIASVYFGKYGPGHKSPAPIYSWGVDLLDNHQQLLHWKFLTEPNTRHIWRNSQQRHLVFEGGRPSWKPQVGRPAWF